MGRIKKCHAMRVFQEKQWDTWQPKYLRFKGRSLWICGCENIYPVSKLCKLGLQHLRRGHNSANPGVVHICK